MGYFIIILYSPLYVLGFFMGLIGRPIMSGIAVGYFFMEISERKKALNKSGEKIQNMFNNIEEGKCQCGDKDTC
uniref:Uncharacterized protein n=1 Tax=viral metagenome TaxID=1070528 RepID=A0A6M3LDW3_9ZZZZ